MFRIKKIAMGTYPYQFFIGLFRYILISSIKRKSVLFSYVCLLSFDTLTTQQNFKSDRKITR